MSRSFKQAQDCTLYKGLKLFKNILELLAFASPVQTSYSVADEQVAIEDDPHLQNYNQAKLRYKKVKVKIQTIPTCGNYVENRRRDRGKRFPGGDSQQKVKIQAIPLAEL